MSFRPRRVLVAIAALIVLVAAPAGALAGQPGSAQTEHERILAYWTKERIAGAVPRDMIRGVGPKVPAAKPPGAGGSGGGTTSTVTGASWTGGGEIVERSGRVLFTLGGVNYICSASVAADDNDPSYSLVLTAAHCAYDEVADVFASNWTYIPAFDLSPTYTCASSQFGCWTARALVVHNGFANEEGFTDNAVRHDFAFAVVGPGGKTGTQVDALGAYPVQIGGLSTGATVYAFGYPAAGKYKGKDLVYCKGPLGTDPYTDNTTWKLGCDMTGGSSGGPWLAGTGNPADGSGWLVSANSYGYSGIVAMHGPKFNDAMSAVYGAAKSATPDATGIDGIKVN